MTTQKVTFRNQYRMKVAGNLFIPKASHPNGKWPRDRRRPPDGSSEGAKRESVCSRNWPSSGFVTLSLDLSFWGESEGEPRNAVLPDVYAEEFSAAVDSWAPGRSLTGPGLAP